jgi:hypothetical protein
MLWSPTYLESRLRRPLPIKDAGLPNCPIGAPVLATSPPAPSSFNDVVTLRWQVELALFCDAQLDLAAIRMTGILLHRVQEPCGAHRR